MAAIRLHHAPFALPEARTGFATTLRGTVDPLGRFAMVVFQQATESIKAFDVASNKADFIAGVLFGGVDWAGTVLLGHVKLTKVDTDTFTHQVEGINGTGEKVTFSATSVRKTKK